LVIWIFFLWFQQVTLSYGIRRTSWNTSKMSRPSKLTSLFLSSNVMCLMSHWQIIFSIRVSSFILTMWPVEIKGKIFKLPIKVINGKKLMSTQKKFKVYHTSCETSKEKSLSSNILYIKNSIVLVYHTSCETSKEKSLSSNITSLCLFHS
jgi:hypothetical protein